MRILYFILLLLILSNAFFIYDFINRPEPKTETILKSDTLYIHDTTNHIIINEVKSTDTFYNNQAGALLKLDTTSQENLKLSIVAFCPDTGNNGTIEIAYTLPPVMQIRDSITTIKTILIPGGEGPFYKRFGFGYVCGLATAAGVSYFALKLHK